MSEERVYIDIEEANRHLVQAQAQTLANVELGLGTILATAQEAEVDPTMRSYVAGLRSAVDIIRPVLDAMLESPIRLVAGVEDIRAERDE